VPLGAIPSNATRVTCPCCKHQFSLDREARPDRPAEPASPPPRPPVAGEAAPPSIPAAPRTLEFTFTGKAGEYFGIWLVNTLLKMLSFGIYSPWAKVRKRRYFYGNTLLADAPFDYLADPLAILKGWLLGAALFIIYSFASHFYPKISSFFGLLFFLGMPWLIVRSYMFNARNSAYRNLRCAFNPDYREAYVVFAGLYLLVPFTLGVLLPYVVYRQKKFLIENSSYGRTRFQFDATPREFYAIFLRAAGGILAIITLVFVVGFLASSTFQESVTLLLGSKPDPATLQKAAAALTIAVMLTIFSVYLFLAVYVQTAMQNLIWSRVRLGDFRFRSTLKTGKMAWLLISSALAIAGTLGLLIPWAAIRLARYRFANLTVEASQELSGFITAAEEQVGAAGEEIGDIFGIDIGI